jgi:Domain of unknown function (DUF4388)
MPDAFPISGNIDPKAFPFLLTDLHRHGATGSLKVEGPTYQKALYFRGGRILFGSSNDPRDQLGAILIENGKINSEQLEDVNTKVGPGRPLAKVLSETGLVSQQELSEAAQIKVERILWDIITYTAGAFEFEDGVLPKGAVDLKLSTERLILAAVRRVTDQAFITRHIGDSGVILRPTSELAERLHEVESEAGGLAEQIDGRTTLRNAAATAQLDEVEAAKIACGLLILGLVEKSDGGDESLGEPMILPDEDEPSIDLGQTARESVEAEPSETPFFVPEGMEEPAKTTILPPTATMMMESEPEPQVDTVMMSAPTPMLAPESEPDPSFFMPPEPPPRQDGVGSKSHPRELPLVPPPPRREVAPEPVPTEIMPLPEEVEAPTLSVPPSKEDMAALDALLNPRRHESSPRHERLEKDANQWEPRFSALSGGARKTKHGVGVNGTMLAGALAIVVVGAAAVGWFYMSQGTTKAHPVAAATARTAAPAVPTQATAAPLVPTTAPVESLHTSAPTAAPVVPTAAPTRTEPRVPVSAPTQPPASIGGNGTGDVAQARTLLRSGRYREAANAFETHLRRAASASFTIQLLVACSDDTVHKAAESVPQDELYITPVDYKGRACYRMGWGLYDNDARATQALRAVPDYFHQPGVTPRVVPAATFLH